MSIRNMHFFGQAQTELDWYTNLVHAYRFSDNKDDSIGSNDINGTLGYTDLAKTGRAGSLTTNVINAPYVSTNSFVDGSGDLSFSIHVRIKPTTLSGAHILFGKGVQLLEHEISGFIDGSQRLQFILYNGSASSDFICVITTETLSTDTIYNLLFTYDGSVASSGLKIYINGSLATLTSLNNGTYTGMTDYNNNLNLGWVQRKGATANFVGSYDEFYIWRDRELSASEATALNNDIENELIPSLQSQGIFNTIIAGEGVNTTSAAQLETLLGLTSGDVTSFTLQGNDIYAYINVNYEIPYEAFYENYFVLSFIDLENKVTAINGRCFWKARFITEIKIEGCTTVNGNRNFLDANRLESLKTNINGDLPEAFLRNAFNLTEFTYDTLYDLNASALDNTGLSSITIYGTRLLDRCLVKNSNLTSVIAPNVTEVRDQVFEDSNALTSLDLSLATSIGRFCFRRCSELVDLDIRSALTLGSGTGDNEVFKDVKNGINIIAHNSLQTSNGGGVEGDIAYAIANHSANVTYI